MNTTTYIHTPGKIERELTDGEHPDNPINRHTDHPLSLLSSRPTTRTDQLHPNIHRRLLSKPHDLRSGPPIPTNQRFIGPG